MSPMDDNWDTAIDEIRNLSDKLKGFVTTLVNEGWTEEQARNLIVATYVAASHGKSVSP